MEIKAYMTDFPFDFFLIINNAKELGDILGATLMQFIQEKWHSIVSNFAYVFIYFSFYFFTNIILI